MAATTLPRTVRIAVWTLAGVLWALVPVTAVMRDAEGVIVAVTLAALSTGFLYLAAVIDRLAARQRDSFDERQAMLIGVIEQLAHGAPATGPQPVVQEPTALRAVAS